MKPIKHEPLVDVKKAEKHYTDKDGVETVYVCTTDLRASDVPTDIFYRDTPHPKFGNRYLGLFFDHFKGHMMICNADMVEELEFGMVECGGELHYSQSHHDYKVLPNGKMIDGGRVYVRSSHGAIMMRVKDGKFQLADVEDLVDYYEPGGCVQ